MKPSLFYEKSDVTRQMITMMNETNTAIGGSKCSCSEIRRAFVALSVSFLIIIFAFVGSTLGKLRQRRHAFALRAQKRVPLRVESLRLRPKPWDLATIQASSLVGTGDRD